MQIFYQQTSLPRIKQSSLIPKGHDATFDITFERKEFVSGEFYYPAKMLIEHIDIIIESRKFIKEGKTIAWEEFYKNHAPKRRK